MRGLLRLPGVRHLHERQLLFPALVLVVVAAVLVHGALDRERAARADRGTAESADAESADADQRETSIPLRAPAGARLSLRGDLEKTPLSYFSDYWSQLASEMRVHLLEVGGSGQSGLVIEPGLAVTTATTADALMAVEARTRLAAAKSENADTVETVETAENSEDAGDTAANPNPDVTTDGGAVASSGVRAIDRGRGIALVEVNDGLPPFVDGDPLALSSGAYVGAVTLDAEGMPSITPGYLVSASSNGDLVTSLPPPVSGLGAVVDLDGLLIGVMYRASDGVRTTTIEAFRRELDRMEEQAPCRAISVVQPDVGVLDLLGRRGLLIDRVVASAFVPEPSLRAGDVLIEWNDEPVTNVEGFQATYDALGPGELVRYRVIRGRRTVAGGTILPDTECRAEAPAVVRLIRLGLEVEWRDEAELHGGASSEHGGWIVTTVVPDGIAGQAGISEGDRLLAVDGRAVPGDDGARARAAIERLDANDSPLLLSLGRGDRVTLAALMPVEP